MLKSFYITGTAKELGAIGTPTEFAEIMYNKTLVGAIEELRKEKSATKSHVHIETVEVATVVGIGDCVWVTVDPEEYI